MNAPARNALRTIRRCIEGGRYRLLQHFVERMDHRGATWPDVLAVLDAPASVRGDGEDDWGRPRWIVQGEAADGLPLGILCVLGRDQAGDVAVFITMFWQD